MRAARSRDGLHFEVDPRPALFPETAFETFGIEDPRITQIGADFAEQRELARRARNQA